MVLPRAPTQVERALEDVGEHHAWKGRMADCIAHEREPAQDDVRTHDRAYDADERRCQEGPNEELVAERI